MSKLRVNCFAVSLDGYGAGPNQDEQNPLEKGGTDLHQMVLSDTCAPGSSTKMHLAISPVLLGSGEHLLHDLNLRALGYRVAAHVPGERATHVVVKRADV